MMGGGTAGDDDDDEAASEADTYAGGSADEAACVAGVGAGVSKRSLGLRRRRSGGSARSCTMIWAT